MGDLDFEVIGRVLPYLAAGLQYTIQLTLVAAAGGVVFGTLLAMARLSASRPLALAAAGYVVKKMVTKKRPKLIDLSIIGASPSPAAAATPTTKLIDMSLIGA